MKLYVVKINRWKFLGDEMKILFYINSLCHGGAERVINNLSTQFSEHGYDCVLVTSFLADNEYSMGKKAKRISLFPQKLSCNFLKRNYLLAGGLRKVLKEEKPDVLVSFMAEPNFRAIVASFGLKNKVVVSVRNDPNREYGTFITKILAKILFRRADGIVFQTEDAKKWFPKSIQKKSKIIFNQVDEVFYNTKYEGERHDIITTGRLVPQKNHKLLIRAFAAIADKVPDNLFIYGEGELRSELETLIAELHMQDRIFLPGGIKNVADTIKSAKLFVLSSDYEGMPNSLMEAMALGIPCISTDCPCGGPRELFGENLKKNLVVMKNESKLAQTMLNVLCTQPKEIEIKTKERAQLFFPTQIYTDWAQYIQIVVSNR